MICDFFLTFPFEFSNEPLIQFFELPVCTLTAVCSWNSGISPQEGCDLLMR